MVGTTDEKCAVTHQCEPTQEEIDFIIKEIKPYFPEDYDFKSNLVGAWAGIRPLAKHGNNDYVPEKNDGFITSTFKSGMRKLASLVNGSKK